MIAPQAKAFALSVVVGATLLVAGAQTDAPRRDFVPDAETAVRVAEAVLIPIYGKKQVASERPFHARLERDHWIVTGTLKKSNNPGYIVMGGSMTAEIDRST
jgi:hypothetical protein